MQQSSSLRILKNASCPTLSGKGTLNYQLGCKNEKIHFRITANSGGGYFNAEWVSTSSIQDCLANATKPITSFAFSKLFLGKSTNTPAFLLATLVNEKLLTPSADKQRGYEILDSAAFMAEATKLIESDINLNSELTPAIKSTSPMKSKKVSVFTPTE